MNEPAGRAGRPNRWSSFPFQLFMLTILPLALLLLAIAFGSLSLHQQAMRTMVGERDERATRAAAAAMTEQLNQRAATARALALQTASSGDATRALADAAAARPGFDGGLAVLDAGGALLGATQDVGWWRERAVAAALAALLAGDGRFAAGQFSPPFDDPTGDGLVVLVAFTTAEGVTGAGAFDPASLARGALSGIFGGSHLADAAVVAADGRLLYQAGHLTAAAAAGQRPGLADALRGESGVTYYTIDGDERVVAFSPIAPVGWALVVEEPWRGMADPLLRATELIPLVLIPVLLIAVVGLWFGFRQIVQPLQALAGQATALGWGDFGAIEEPAGGIGEIRRLQTELIHMAQKVKVAQQGLRGYLGALTAGQEEERRRLARELHDDTIQSLIALNQRIQLAQLSAADPATVRQLADMQQMAEATIIDLRRLTRDLRPIYLEDLGLAPALEMLTQETARALQIPVTFAVEGTVRRLPPQVELALYRIAQEGLSNVARHAQASAAQVALAFGNDAIRLAVADDGVGFVAPPSPADMAPAGHYGLLGIQERAEAIGAQLTIRSRPGRGTELGVSLAVALLPHELARD